MNIHSANSTLTAGTSNKQPPAQAARAAMADQAGLADQPFGKLVSDFARGITPLSAAAADNGTSDQQA